MRTRATTAGLALCLLGAVACGKDDGSPAAAKDGARTTPAVTPPASTTPPTTPPTSVPAAPGTSTGYVGTLEPLGVSLYMEGTHKLTEKGVLVVLLKSTRVDLSKQEGKRVRVTGPSAATVEGGKTIVDVETVAPAP